ncbi:cation transporter [Marinobacter hydrocarbonoclasticus]|nr:cation transporter [Marinobacter nauticus]
MAGCCNHNAQFDGASAQYRRILWLIIAINGVMFLVEMVAGIGAQSQALQADALDFLGDTLTYGISLWAIGKALSVRANVAMFKGVSLLLMSLWVMGSTLYRVFVLNAPDPYTMGSIAIAAFIANLASVLLLARYKDGDANVRSVWLCSRNDAIGNLVVVAAASGVWASSSAWPDLAVAFVLSALFLSSSWQILKLAIQERQTSRALPQSACSSTESSVR